MNDWNKLKDEHTLALIRIVQNKDSMESSRKNAFHALCHRFKQVILKRSEIVCKRFGHDITVAEQVTTATFTAYARKGNFQTDKAIKTDVDEAFKRYLYKIAKNELTNYYREQQRKKDYPFDGSERVITELPLLKGMKLNMEQTILIKAIESLTPAQRTVYLTYKQYEKLSFNLPKTLLLKLRNHLGGISQSTVRSYKKEAVDRIESYIDIMNLTKELSNGKV